MVHAIKISTEPVHIRHGDQTRQLIAQPKGDVLDWMKRNPREAIIIVLTGLLLLTREQIVELIKMAF